MTKWLQPGSLSQRVSKNMYISSALRMRIETLGQQGGTEKDASRKIETLEKHLAQTESIYIYAGRKLRWS